MHLPYVAASAEHLEAAFANFSIGLTLVDGIFWSDPTTDPLQLLSLVMQFKAAVDRPGRCIT